MNEQYDLLSWPPKRMISCTFCSKSEVTPGSVKAFAVGDKRRV